jgi:transposase-like protein
VWAVWPTVAGWLRERVRARVVLVDEKWLKIRGQWRYWFVVLDEATGIPICTALADHRSEAVCCWLGVQLRLLGYCIQAVVHDGLAAYAALLPEVVHQRCLFHWQQGVTRWVREHLGTTEEAETRKQAMKRVVQTSDTRTVRRRLTRVGERAEVWGIGAWVTQTTQQRDTLLPAMGRTGIPTTTNASERFFRAFMRFDTTRGGVHSVRSAPWECLLFLVGSRFTQRATDGKAPIEAIVPEAAQMPLYRVINDPFALLGQCKDVKQTPDLAGELVHARLAA